VSQANEGSKPNQKKGHGKNDDEDEVNIEQLSQLRNHSVSHMNKELEVVPIWSSKKKCELCGKFLADSKCLKKYIQAVHSKLKPYICQVCNHQSARKSMLELHMRQHTGDKPFSCEECPYKTGDHNSLRRHKMRHSGERPYKCSYCDYSSIQSEAYKNHIVSKHSNKAGSKTSVFVCSHCSYKTVKSDSYFNHVKEKHTEGKDIDNLVKQTSDKMEHNEVRPKSWLEIPDSSSHSFLHLNMEHDETPASKSLTSIKLPDSKAVKLINKSQEESTIDKSKSKIVSITKKSKKLEKRRKLAATSKNANSTKKLPGKIEKVRKERKEPKAKEIIVEEEDSLHSAMDLGGTTIPADPIKAD